MCGRFFLRPDVGEILAFLKATPADLPPQEHPRWNIAPTQQVLAAFQDPFGERRLGSFRWGLVPSWWREARPPAFFNARSEEIGSKPAFRDAFKRSRALVPVSGFYEWKAGSKPKDPKQAYAIEGEGLLALAAVVSEGRIDGEPVSTLALLTTSPNADMAPVHDRMPVILAPEDWTAWLDPRTPGTALAARLVPWHGPLRLRAVDAEVNNARHTSGAWMT